MTDYGSPLSVLPACSWSSFETWSNTSLYLFCATGVWISYLLYGYLQEGLTAEFRKDGQLLGWFMTSSQFATSAIVSFMQIWLQGSRREATPQPALPYALIGLGAVVSMGFSNTACLFLNYPTQVMFRSSKLIPTMVLGAFVFRQVYSRNTYLASFLIVQGLIILTLADRTLSPNFDPVGILFISISVTAGAMIANFQEFLFKRYQPTEGQLLLHMKAWGLLFLTLICLGTGQMTLGFRYFHTRLRLAADLLAWAWVATLGELFQMLLIKRFGSLLNVTTTVCRQAITIYLSFLLFPKPYSHWYVVAAVSIFGGMFLNIYEKNSQSIDKFCRHFSPSKRKSKAA